MSNKTLYIRCKTSLMNKKKGRRHEAEPGKEESDKRWQPEHPIKPLKRLTAIRNEPTDEFVNIRSHTHI